MLPIRLINVDGLKLDRDIVEHFVANDKDYSIIKAIQVYSDMTGTECVAEGVDSEEKFEKLVALGVKRFGVIIFPARLKKKSWIEWYGYLVNGFTMLVVRQTTVFDHQ